MNNPLVSIIIPTYNRAHLIGETLDSVLVQTYENWECIVIDDGSTDDTQSIVQKYSLINDRVQFHIRPLERLKGGAAARNYGAELSKGNFIIFMDSDDVFLETAIANRVKYLGIKNTDMLINNTGIFFKEQGDSNLLWNSFNRQDINIDLIKRFINGDTPWSTNSVTWNKDFFLKVGKWNENLTAWQDWELHLRALFFNPLVSHFDKSPDNFYRATEHNSIKDSFLSKKYYLSMEKTYYSISNLLLKNIEIKEKVTDDFEKLTLRFLIKNSLKRKMYFRPLRHLFNSTFNLVFDKKVYYIKFYVVEIFCLSFKIKKYFFNTIYYKQQEYIKTTGGFMKKTL